MAMYFTTENFRKLVPRLSENRSMAAIAANLGMCAYAVTTPTGAFLATAMSWSQYASVFTMWGVATLTMQRYFARGYQGIHIENQLTYQLGHHMAGQTVVVTGASSGIGYELALRLAQNGCETVIMACRDEEKTKAAIMNASSHVNSLSNQLAHWPSEPHYRQWESKHTERLKFMQLDLADETSIAEFVKELTWQHPKIDLLVNNAGEFSFEKNRMTKSGHEHQVAVNALGPFMLTEMLLPALEKRIVYVTSVAHKLPSGEEDFDIVGVLDTLQYAAVAHNPPTAGDEAAAPPVVTATPPLYPTEAETMAELKNAREAAIRFRIEARGETLEKAKESPTPMVYGPTKLINLFHARDLSERLHDRGVSSVAVHPGGVTTSIFRDVPVVREVVSVLGPLFFKTPVQGARTVLQCCIAEDVKNGAFYADGWVAESHASPLSKSVTQRRAVMEWCSEQWDRRVPLTGSSLH